MSGVMVQRYLAPASKKEWPAIYTAETAQAWTMAGGRCLRSFINGYSENTIAPKNMLFGTMYNNVRGCWYL